jgi:hypothetical protein
MIIGTLRHALMITSFVFVMMLVLEYLNVQTKGGWQDSLLALFIVSTVPEHFLEERLWEHIVKVHIPRVFLWTFIYDNDASVKGLKSDWGFSRIWICTLGLSCLTGYLMGELSRLESRIFGDSPQGAVRIFLILNN